MRKLTAMIVASPLALSSASFAFAAETTAPTPPDAHGKMLHHKGPQHFCTRQNAAP